MPLPHESGDLHEYFPDCEGGSYSTKLLPLSITSGMTQLEYIFGLFRNYFFNSFILERQLRVYVFAQRTIVFFDTSHRSRPYGGTAILYRKELAGCVSAVETFDSRITAIKFTSNTPSQILTI